MDSTAADQDRTASIAAKRTLQRVVDRLAQQFPDVQPEELARAVHGENLRLAAGPPRGHEPTNVTCAAPTEPRGRVPSHRAQADSYGRGTVPPKSDRQGRWRFGISCRIRYTAHEDHEAWRSVALTC
jgi:hypothetical protein